MIIKIGQEPLGETDRRGAAAVRKRRDFLPGSQLQASGTPFLVFDRQEIRLGFQRL
jgi:hypothetical protein